MNPDPSIRFLLFLTGDMYEVSGVMEDCIGKYATAEEARANAVVHLRGKVFTGNDKLTWDDKLLGPWAQHEIYDTWTGDDIPVIQRIDCQ